MKSFVHRPEERILALRRAVPQPRDGRRLRGAGAAGRRGFQQLHGQPHRRVAFIGITEVYHGPKARVAVSRFEVKRGVPADLSDGLAGMLRAALANRAASPRSSPSSRRISWP